MTSETFFKNLFLGNDLVFVPRLQASYQRHGMAFLLKVLTEAELQHCLSSSPKDTHIIRRAAGKIAVKEAVSKALGTGLNGFGWDQGVTWHSIEVIAQNQQAPSLRLNGIALQKAQALGITDWKISLSHDGDYAMAVAIGLVH